MVRRIGYLAMVLALVAGPGCASCVDEDVVGQPWDITEPRQQAAPLCEGFEARQAEPGWGDGGQRRRDLGVHVDGCGAYRATMAFTNAGLGRVDWRTEIDWTICNRCDTTQAVDVVHYDGDLEAKDHVVDGLERLQFYVLPALSDETGARYLAGCSHHLAGDGAHRAPVVRRLELAPGESVGRTDSGFAVGTFYHGVGYLRDARMPYWDAPVDYARPLSLELWWPVLRPADAPMDERLAVDHYAGCDAIGLGYRYGSESDFEASTTRHAAPAPGLPPSVQQYMAATDAEVAP